MLSNICVNHFVWAASKSRRKSCESARSIYQASRDDKNVFHLLIAFAALSVSRLQPTLPPCKQHNCVPPASPTLNSVTSSSNQLSDHFVQMGWPSWHWHVFPFWHVTYGRHIPRLGLLPPTASQTSFLVSAAERFEIKSLCYLQCWLLLSHRWWRPRFHMTLLDYCLFYKPGLSWDSTPSARKGLSRWLESASWVSEILLVILKCRYYGVGLECDEQVEERSKEVGEIYTRSEHPWL